LERLEVSGYETEPPMCGTLTALVLDGAFVALPPLPTCACSTCPRNNLAVLVDALDLTEELRERAPGLAWRTLSWIVRRQAQRADHLHAALIQVKNTAYAWRQAPVPAQLL
jgi:hypothetical protein